MASPVFTLGRPNGADLPLDPTPLASAPAPSRVFQLFNPAQPAPFGGAPLPSQIRNAAYLVTAGTPPATGSVTPWVQLDGVWVTMTRPIVVGPAPIEIDDPASGTYVIYGVPMFLQVTSNDGGLKWLACGMSGNRE